jgi:hypothetical protein
MIVILDSGHVFPHRKARPQKIQIMEAKCQWSWQLLKDQHDNCSLEELMKQLDQRAMAVTMTRMSTDHHNHMIPPSRQHKAQQKQLRLQILPISFKYLPSPLFPHA